ncbi:MAG: tetratricopeptide repeat protein, partial [Nanoarchaeota archaeon]
SQEKYEKALEYYNKSFNIMKKLNDSLGISHALNNFGAIFEEQKEHKKALKYFFNSLEIANKIKNKDQEALCYDNIAIVYRKENNIEKAFEYYQKSLIIHKELEDKEGLATNFINICDIYLKKKNYSLALKNLKKADTLAKEINSLDLSKDIYLNFSEVYEAKDNLDSALKYYKKFSETKDSLLNSESLKQVAEIETKYQTEKKELENTSLKKDNQIIEEKNTKQKWGLFGLIGILGLGGIFGYSLHKSRKKIQEKNREITEKNREITDSINYAKNIQTSILPKEEEFNKLLPENFVFYKPKDIVSGDFYWLTEKDEKIFFSACDCTGHGVPGAFIHATINAFLNSAINEKQLEKPNEIFNYVRKNIINSLKSKGENIEQKDGMDSVLCVLDKSQNTLEFACANNPLYLIRDNKITDFKEDRMPVGYSDELKPFKNNVIELKKNDMIYLFSDGYPSQFGGPKGKKFMKKNLRELLFSISQKPVNEQKEILNKTIDDWMAYINPNNKKPYEQTDDLCVIGVRFDFDKSF